MRKFLVILLALFAYMGAGADTAKVKVTNGGTTTWVDIEGTVDGTNFTPAGYCIHYSTEGILNLSEVWSGEGTGTQYTVTAIGQNAFYNRSHLTGVIIPDGVTTIGNDAFASCWEVTSIDIPNSVETIGPSAFASCSKLASVNLGSGVKTIGNSAFSGCEVLNSVTIPRNVETIGQYAFSGCTALTTITIPSNVESIGFCAFQDCTALTSADIACSTIVDNAFSGCSELAQVVIRSSVKTIQCAFMNLAKLASVTFEEGVKTIESSAFAGSVESPALTNIVLPNSLESIGENAFGKCEALTNLTLGNGLKTIGANAFSGCISLNGVVIPDNVETMGDCAFYGCTSLASVSIGIGLKTIPQMAFYGCTSLTGVAIPDNVETIGDFAFTGCTSLASLTLGKGLKTIGENSFQNCKETSLIIPANVTSIKRWAFGSNSNLTSLEIQGMPSVGESVFSSTNLTKILVNAAAMNFLKTNTTWCDTPSYRDKVEPKLYLNSDIATFSSDVDLDFSGSAVRAYIITGYENGTLKTEQVTKIPAGTGVLLSGTTGAYTDISMATSTDDVTDNLLQPTNGTAMVPATEGTNTNFILTKTSDEKYTFVTLAEDGVISKGKAYLPLPTSAASNSFVIDFSSQTDGIKTATTAEDDKATIYDLQGRRVEKAANGIYIVNGKKMLVK